MEYGEVMPYAAKIGGSDTLIYMLGSVNIEQIHPRTVGRFCLEPAITVKPEHTVRIYQFVY